jgi:hypothetical protein
MQRKNFLSFIGLSSLSAFFPGKTHAGSPGARMPELLFFKDDGKIPNSKFPLQGKREGLVKLWATA